MTEPEITDEHRKEIIKKCITTQAGWQALAQSINSAPDKDASLQKCCQLLCEIGGDKKIDMPTLDDAGNVSTETINIKMSDLLVSQLLGWVNGTITIK